MHLPDGFLSAPVSVAMGIASAGAVAAAVKRVSEEDGVEGPARAATPLMGVVAAFVFAAQMFNFPISGATTGHLLGAALATALLGPWRAILAMTAVFLIQTFLFADGGVVVLGANLFNMGVAGCLVSALILNGLRRFGPLVALAVAAWAAVMAAAALTAVELALSGTIAAAVVLPSMLAVHAVIGVGEALLSVAAYRILAGARPDLLALQPAAGSRGALEPWRIAAVLLLGLVIVRLAFPHPDGLEFVAEQQGFSAAGRDGFAAAPLPDYALPAGAPAEGFDWLGSYLSALIGMVACGLMMFAVGAGFRRSGPAEAA